MCPRAERTRIDCTFASFHEDYYLFNSRVFREECLLNGYMLTRIVGNLARRDSHQGGKHK